MDISVIPIGNSKGIRLTKTLIEKYNITYTVELILENGYIIIKPKVLFIYIEIYNTCTIKRPVRGL